MSAQKRDSSDEIRQLRSELQFVIEQRQTSMLHDLRVMMAEAHEGQRPIGVQQG